MYQIIPLRWFVIAAVWLAISALLLIDWGAGVVGVAAPVRYSVLFVDALLIALTWKPVWRALWSYVPGLRGFFPDLNGEYDVELRHNWPIQQSMLDAAVGTQPFDPRLPSTKLPELGISKLRAAIDLSFYSINITMWSEDPNNPTSIIDQSRALSVSLLRPCDGQPHRLVYVYQQKNRRDRRMVTDDSTFEGAAILNISKKNHELLQGEYWTNRAWHYGLSTAGIISLTKRL